MRPFTRLLLAASSLLAWTPVFGEEAAAEVSRDDAFRAMGFAMGSQLRLNIGFSDEELNLVFAGMRRAAREEGEPEGFREAIRLAQQIYTERMTAFQEVERERADQKAKENKAAGARFFAELAGREGIRKTDSGLYYEILEEGTGAQPGPTDRVRVNYRGVLIDGREFDANEGAEFMVNRVVPGFSEGLQLMREGGKIKLYIPSNLAYGDRPAMPGSIIEPGSTLIFDVELLSVTEGPKPPTTTPPRPPDITPPPPPTTPPPTTTPPRPPDITPPPPPTTPPPTTPPPPPPTREPPPRPATMPPSPPPPPPPNMRPPPPPTTPPPPPPGGN